jgi:hypothetical protein
VRLAHRAYDEVSAIKVAKDCRYVLQISHVVLLAQCMVVKNAYFGGAVALVYYNIHHALIPDDAGLKDTKI